MPKQDCGANAAPLYGASLQVVQLTLFFTNQTELHFFNCFLQTLGHDSKHSSLIANDEAGV